MGLTLCPCAVDALAFKRGESLVLERAPGDQIDQKAMNFSLEGEAREELRRKQDEMRGGAEGAVASLRDNGVDLFLAAPATTSPRESATPLASIMTRGPSRANPQKSST